LVFAYPVIKENNMKINCNFNKSSKILKKYFVLFLNFELIIGENFTPQTLVEDEIHLVNRITNSHIDIIKYYNDDEMDLTIDGPSEWLKKYSLYIDYFFNKQLLIDANLNEFIKKVDKQIEKMEFN